MRPLGYGFVELKLNFKKGPQTFCAAAGDAWDATRVTTAKNTKRRSRICRIWSKRCTRTSLNSKCSDGELVWCSLSHGADHVGRIKSTVPPEKRLSAPIYQWRCSLNVNNLPLLPRKVTGCLQLLPGGCSHLTLGSRDHYYEAVLLSSSPGKSSESFVPTKPAQPPAQPPRSLGTWLVCRLIVELVPSPRST